MADFHNLQGKLEHLTLMTKILYPLRPKNSNDV